jgi:hypothetical protein
MVHRFKELENYDDYDPTPYQGGYDINEAYGGVKAADEECAYRRTENLEDDEEPEVRYGHESNPYEHGPPGPSIFGGRSRPGAVYGGGRDRTRPDHDQAQPDQGVATGYDRRKLAYGADSQPGYRRPYRGEDEEDSGYRKSRPTYGGEEEDSGYYKPRPSYGYGEEDSSYRKPRPSYGYGEYEESSYHKPQPTYGYGEEEDSSYRKPRPSYGYGEEDSGYRKPRPNYGEDEDSGYRKPSHGYGQEGSGYRRAHDEEQSSGYRKPYNYGEEGYYRPRPGYGREESSEAYEGGYGGYGSYGGRRNDDDDMAKFGGGSVYTEEPLPEPAPAKRSWW